MGGHYQILLPLLSIFLVRVDLTDLIPVRMEVKILKVYDGDTVLVSRGNYRMKVRLSRIDSPELKQPYIRDQRNAGEFSRKCLIKLLKNKAILTIEKEDIYGRILGDLDKVTFRMIQKGCTTLYPHAEFSSKKEKFRYLFALKKAKARKRGLWKYGGIIQPKKWRRISKRSARRR